MLRSFHSCFNSVKAPVLSLLLWLMAPILQCISQGESAQPLCSICSHSQGQVSWPVSWSGGQERGGSGYSLQHPSDTAARLEQGILHSMVQEVMWAESCFTGTPFSSLGQPSGTPRDVLHSGRRDKCWRVRELLWCSVSLGSPWDIARNLGLSAAGLLCCAAEQFRLFVNPVCWGGQRLSTTSLNIIWNWFLEINMKKKILGKCQDETF